MTRKIYIGMLVCVVILHIAATCGNAATLTVTNKNNSGSGSLRQAIIDAAAGDTIVFAAGLNGAILLSATDLTIDKTLNIAGPGANVLRLEMRLSSQRRVVRVTAGTVSISGLTLSGGNFQTSSTVSKGGSGLLVELGASVTLNNSMIRKNNLSYDNNNSQINGIVQNHGTLTINNSSVIGNVSYNAAGGIANYGTLSMTNTTVSRNVVFVDSSGVGGVHNVSGTITMLNCTIADNFGTAGNTGGVMAEAGTTIIRNTIIGANFIDTGIASSSDVNGTFSSQGTNLIGNTTGGSGFSPTDLQNVNPLLGTVTGGGGTTYTAALTSGSPAINAGSNTGSPATDQRGVSRPQNGVIDIGAYEFGVKPPAYGKIVFVSDRDGNHEIYTMNPDGTNQTRLTINTADERWPRLSPDGSKIVFASDRDGGNTSRIYVMNADGSNPTLLTPNSFGGGDLYPSWSPDGNRIVFTGTATTSPPTPAIYALMTMNADGSNRTGILGSPVPNAAFGNPIFSRDGSKIIYSHIPNSASISNIFSINVDGSDETTLTTGNRSNFEPALSPDGNIVAFRHDTTGASTAWRIYQIGLPSGLNPGSDLHPFINPQISQQEFYPAWSPDGTKLIYHTDSSFLGGDLYIRDADGTTPVLLVGQAINGRTLDADWVGIQTATGTNVQAISGTTTVNFAGVSNGGTTTAVPINSSDAGMLPGGYSFGPGYPAFNVTTTAAYTAPVTVCVQVPAVATLAEFGRLRLFHNEGGTLIDRTISQNFPTRTICAQTTSLSPFAVATTLAPTAANVSVGGRVSHVLGMGVSNVHVSLTGQNGDARTAITNSFGYFRFDEVEAGQTYIVSVRNKRFQFENDTQTIHVLDEIANLTFVAQPDEYIRTVLSSERSW